MNVRMLYCDPDWPNFAGADWLANIMNVVVTDRLHEKQGRSIARWTLTSEDGRTLVVYLKRHYRMRLLDRAMAKLWPWKASTPGMQECRHLQWAHDQGIPVPKPMAAGELVNDAGHLQSFLVVEELTDMLALHEAVPLAHQSLDADAFVAFKRGLGEEMARLTKILHSRHVFHKDLYFCHFYIPQDFCTSPPDGWMNRVFVIDLHRLATHPLTRVWWKVKDLAQLLYSSDVEGVSERDRVRFWRQYRGARRSWAARLLLKFVRIKGMRYTRHNRKHG